MSDGINGPQKIKIVKNHGINYALRNLVNELKNKMPDSIIISDDNISSSEWDATMDALIRIQESRKQEGKASIFSGGTDKTSTGWKTSFIVHAGQEIEFTADEMKMLYDAMGVEVKQNSNSASENNEAGATGGIQQPSDSLPQIADTTGGIQQPLDSLPQIADTTGGIQQPLDSLPQIADTTGVVNQQPLDSTAQTADTTGVVNQQPLDSTAQTGDTTDVVNQPKVTDPLMKVELSKKLNKRMMVKNDKQHPRKAGTTKKRGLFGRKEVTYDENGYISKIKIGNKTTFVIRDKENNIVQYKLQEFLADGVLDDVDILETSYDSEGILKSANAKIFVDGDSSKVKKTVFWDERGRVDLIKESSYDESGNKTKEVRTEYYSDGSVRSITESSYDESGNKTKEVYKKAYGRVDRILEYSYDESGNKTKEVRTEYYPDGSVDRILESSYDESGNKTKTVSTLYYYNSDGSVDRIVESSYDESGNKTKAVFKNVDGRVWSIEEYSYDESGKRTKLVDTYYNSDGRVWSIEEYSYDESGNKTKDVSTYYNSDGSVEYYYAYNEDGEWTKYNPDGSLYEEEE